MKARNLLLCGETLIGFGRRILKTAHFGLGLEAYSSFAMADLAPVSFGQSLARRNRSALPITDTELKLIAAAAIIGLISNPKAGKSTPAPNGTPSAL